MCIRDRPVCRPLGALALAGHRAARAAGLVRALGRRGPGCVARQVLPCLGVGRPARASFSSQRAALPA
eukprot:1380194-Alexandrium_andersonii.AAC.1